MSFHPWIKRSCPPSYEEGRPHISLDLAPHPLHSRAHVASPLISCTGFPSPVDYHACPSIPGSEFRIFNGSLVDSCRCFLYLHHRVFSTTPPTRDGPLVDSGDRFFRLYNFLRPQVDSFLPFSYSVKAFLSSPKLRECATPRQCRLSVEDPGPRSPYFSPCSVVVIASGTTLLFRHVESQP